MTDPAGSKKGVNLSKSRDVVTDNIMTNNAVSFFQQSNCTNDGFFVPLVIKDMGLVSVCVMANNAVNLGKIIEKSVSFAVK